MFHNRDLEHKINKLHERALCIVYNDDKLSFHGLLKLDNSSTIHHQNIRKLVIEVYKSIHDLSPLFIKDIFVESGYNGPQLRNEKHFRIPNVNKIYKRMESLKAFAPRIWELVPRELKCINDVGKFKIEIKKWQPTECPCRLCRDYESGLGYVNITG